MQAAKDLTLSIGLRAETREVEAVHQEGGVVTEPQTGEETEHTGYFASLGWKPSKILRVDAKVESSSYDDPFTLTAPTDHLRYSLKARMIWDHGVSLTAGYLGHRFENDDSDWESDLDQISVGYSF